MQISGAIGLSRRFFPRDRRLTHSETAISTSSHGVAVRMRLTLQRLILKKASSKYRGITQSIKAAQQNEAISGKRKAIWRKTDF